jgi:hypothetical protein
MLQKNTHSFPQDAEDTMLLTTAQYPHSEYRPTVFPRRRAGLRNASRSPPADRSTVRRGAHQLEQVMTMESSDEEESGVRLDGGAWLAVTPEDGEGEEGLVFPVTDEERLGDVEI